MSAKASSYESLSRFSTPSYVIGPSLKDSPGIMTLHVQVYVYMYMYTYTAVFSDLPHHSAYEVLLITWHCVTKTMMPLILIGGSALFLSLHLYDYSLVRKRIKLNKGDLYLLCVSPRIIVSVILNFLYLHLEDEW